MAVSSSDIQQTINSLKSQLAAIDSELSSSWSSNIQNLPKVNYLLEWNSSVYGQAFIKRQDNTSYMILGRIPVSQTEGANGVNRFLLEMYRYYNDLYQTKKENRLKRINDNWLGNENVSLSILRQCQEFFLTAYNRFLPVIAELLEKKKQIVAEINDLEKTLGVLSTTSQYTRDIAENEKDIAQFNAELKTAQAKITARNLAIYGLPLIGLVVLGYFIYRRKIKL
jgi:hypothetical protein